MSRQATKKVFSSQHFRQKNQGFRALSLAFAGLFCIILLALLPSIGRADSDKNPDKTALLATSQGPARIHYPSSWKELDARVGVLIMLRVADADYPSLNVIEVPGKLEVLDDPRASLGEKLLQEYRAVGILDVHLNNLQPTTVAEYTGYAADLSYTWEGKPIASRVVLITLPDSHLIFTYVYQSTESVKGITPLLHILDSFHLPLDKVLFGKSEAKDSSFLPLLLYSLSLIAICILVYFRLKKRS